MEEIKDFLSSDDSGEENSMKIINKTHKLFLKLRNEYYSFVRPQLKNDYGGFRLTQPIIPESHLLAETTNKKTIRQEIELLIRKKIIRSFPLESPQYPNERYFMLMSDYISQIKTQGSQVATDFADKVIPNHIKTTITTEELKSFGFSQNDIIELTRIHLLYIHGNEYTIGIPAAAAFLQSITEGRKGVVSYLKRMPDAIKTEVERRTVDGSIYYSSFHTKSLYGLGVITFIKTPAREERIRLVYDPYSGTKK